MYSVAADGLIRRVAGHRLARTVPGAEFPLNRSLANFVNLQVADDGSVLHRPASSSRADLWRYQNGTFLRLTGADGYLPSASIADGQPALGRNSTVGTSAPGCAGNVYVRESSTSAVYRIDVSGIAHKVLDQDFPTGGFCHLGGECGGIFVGSGSRLLRVDADDVARFVANIDWYGQGFQVYGVATDHAAGIVLLRSDGLRHVTADGVQTVITTDFVWAVGATNGADVFALRSQGGVTQLVRYHGAPVPTVVLVESAVRKSLPVDGPVASDTYLFRGIATDRDHHLRLIDDRWLRSFTFDDNRVIVSTVSPVSIGPRVEAPVVAPVETPHSRGPAPGAG